MSVRVIVQTIALVGLVSLALWTCKAPADDEFSALRWPPDTISAIHVSGNIYEVTAVPQVPDPLMKVLLIWPPDTTTAKMNSGMLESQMVNKATMSHSTITARSGYPSQILIIWPPDTTE